MESSETTWHRQLLHFLLRAFSFSLPISIALAEPLVFLAIPVWGYGVYKEKSIGRITQSPFWTPILLFSVMALATSIFGLRPATSLGKCHRLLLFWLVLMMATHFAYDAGSVRRDLIFSIKLFILGTSLLAVYDLIRVPFQLVRGVELFDTGNMRDPQFYVVALCFLIALWHPRLWTYRIPFRWMALCLNGIGLIIHFKRGAWFAFLSVVLLVALLKRKKSLLIGFVAFILILFALPQTRERLHMLRDVTTASLGGRWVLWTEVAPGILRDHPWGVGFKGVAHEDFRSYTSSHIQPKLDHLHNNMLQIALETGWIGLLIWFYWMGQVIVLSVRNYRRAQGTMEHSALAMVGITAFPGLLLIGMIEVNFLDTEILMTFAYVMGIVAVQEQILNHRKG